MRLWSRPRGDKFMLVSKWSVFLASLVLPPAGFVLLWLRSGVRTWDKIICSTVLDSVNELMT